VRVKGWRRGGADRARGMSVRSGRRGMRRILVEFFFSKGTIVLYVSCRFFRGHRCGGFLLCSASFWDVERKSMF
jgi:hypothetical protein